MEIKEYVLLRKAQLKDEVEKMLQKPGLAIISVGDNPASESYVRGKMKDSEEIGIQATQYKLEEKTTSDQLYALIQKLNGDPAIDGIIVQLPLPKQLKEEDVKLWIDPEKDVDGFSPLSPFDCCTPIGIIHYLEHEGFSFAGKNAVVLGRSNIVGRPMAKLLLDRSCNVTVLHSKTSDEDRRAYLKNADLIVSAIGKEAYLDDSYEFRPSAVLIDVGINRGEDGKLHGDAIPNLALHFQSPVPGGVGLLTRLSLMENVIEASKRD